MSIIYPVLLAAAAVAGADTTTPPVGAIKPTENEYTSVVKGDLEERLKDPDSALIKLISPPHWAVLHLPNDWPEMRGWATCYKINAKNGSGGYTGYLRYAYVVNDRKVVYHYVENSEYPDFTEAVFNQTCPETTN